METSASGTELGSVIIPDHRFSSKHEKRKLTRWQKIQRKARSISEHLFLRLFIFLLILIDIIIITVELLNNQSSDTLTLVAIGLSFIFLLEIILRLIGFGCSFFTDWLNILDLIIVLLSLSVSILDFLMENQKIINMKYVILFRLIRLPRLIQFFRVIYTQRQILLKSSRLMVSQNKRRFRQDGFDLDLCYITDRVIAMSFPSSGFLTLYRNPISEVARFLDTKHENHYKVYNLCSERTYDTSYFHGRVERVFIDDHNVPILKDMIEFAENSQNWLAEDVDNIIVVHCKGGKGRTGTIICTHLINIGVFTTADECLEYFGQRRTDLSMGSRFQGVETPSQSRYVGYFATIKSNNYVLPKENPLKLSSIVLHNIQGVGKEEGKDFILSIFVLKEKIFEIDFGGLNEATIPKLEKMDNKIIISGFNDCPILHDDVKVCFDSNNKKIPRGYENRPFFFWFHSGFVEDYELNIPRNMLDNLNKKKAWKVFNENFSVQLIFQNDQIPATTTTTTITTNA